MLNTFYMMNCIRKVNTKNGIRNIFQRDKQKLADNAMRVNHTRLI